MWEEKKEARVKARHWFLHGKTTHPQPLRVEGLGVVEVQVRAGRPRSQFSFFVLRFRLSFFVLRPPPGGRGATYFFISLMITCMSAVEILPSPLRS